MWCLAEIALLTLLYATACNAFPYELAQNIAPNNVPSIMGETVVQTQLLTLKPNTTQQSTGNEQIISRTATDNTSDKVIVEENNKIITPEENVEEMDYHTPVDRAIDPEDEYLDNDNDDTPLSFLKQREVKRRAKVPPIITTTKSAGNAIYITVPIYINTSGGMPLTLTVGGQNVPLIGATKQVTNMESPKEVEMEPPAKTSQFNRLLHYNDVKTRNHRITMRAAKRNRNNLHSRSYTRKHMSSPETFRKVGTYSFYF